jgi:hypothetical protein
MKNRSPFLSWPANAGHPGDEGFNGRVDTRPLDGRVKPGHDGLRLG